MLGCFITGIRKVEKATASFILSASVRPALRME
jgi:hypothetical protein